LGRTKTCPTTTTIAAMRKQPKAGEELVEAAAAV
jgi:hypothetical protein